MEPKKSFIQSLLGLFKQEPIRYDKPQATSTQSVAPLSEYSFDREDFRKRISHVESRNQLQPYKTVGVTGDLGRYQVSPDTLKAWSGAWLGKEYDKDSYLNDQDAQDRFFEEYMNVAESYKLKPEEAAIAWHRGWGALGTNEPREVREKKFKEHINNQLTSPDSFAYLNTFRTYGQ